MMRSHGFFLCRCLSIAELEFWNNLSVQGKANAKDGEHMKSKGIKVNLFFDRKGVTLQEIMRKHLEKSAQILYNIYDK